MNQFKANILILTLLLCGIAMSATNNKWELRNYSRTEVLLQVNNQTALVPGTAGNDLGSTTKYWGVMTASAIRPRAQAVSSNTTLTSTSASRVFCSNATATITLANATTVGSGYTCWVSNIAGSGNVSVASTSLINGDASNNVTINATKTYVSNGTNWISF